MAWACYRPARRRESSSGGCARAVPCDGVGCAVNTFGDVDGRDLRIAIVWSDRYATCCIGVRREKRCPPSGCCSRAPHSAGRVNDRSHSVHRRASHSTNRLASNVDTRRRCRCSDWSRDGGVHLLLQTHRRSLARQHEDVQVVTFGYATTGFVSTALAFHQIAVLGERGLSAAAAATNFLPQSVASALVALVVGRLVDRVPSRIVVPFSMLTLMIAVLSLTFVNSAVGAVGFGIALGSAAATMAASEGALLARWIGRETLGTWRGRMTSVMVISTAIAPFVFSLLADWAGSYTSAARLVVVLPVISGVIAIVTPLPSDRHRVRDSQA